MALASDHQTGLTVEQIREILLYEPDSGTFTWRVRRGPKLAGSAAGGMGSDGYFVLGINGRLYKAARIAWIYMTGSWPAREVEHRDTVQDNNRWSNLRLATRSQNLANVKPREGFSSTYKGVSWDKARQRWRASIGRCGGGGLGRFKGEIEAAQAYDKAALEKYGAFARLNFPNEAQVAP